MGDKRALAAIDTRDETLAAQIVAHHYEAMGNGFAGVVSSAAFSFGEPVEA